MKAVFDGGVFDNGITFNMSQVIAEFPLTGNTEIAYGFHEKATVPEIKGYKAISYCKGIVCYEDINQWRKEIEDVKETEAELSHWLLRGVV